LASSNEELEGTTFKVYLYVAREGRPVGTRDVIRNLPLSSSSVAFRYLQKLEALGLLQKNEYGEYTLKEKAGIQGHVWIGRNLVPRLLVYSLFFVGLLTVEISIIIVLFFFNSRFPDTNFVYLTAVTVAAMILLST
jgi:Mn-dependent DtxR family transcriptional regulator